MSRALDFLQPCFLGPQAENAQAFESLLVELVRDHAFWRRNFHPEDGPCVRTHAQPDDAALEFMDRMRTELFGLSGALKRAVPFFSPRYIGHMNADLLMPGLIAAMATMLYNPNNVSEEGAPVTLDMELEAGRQLARMFGFNLDPEAGPCAWGHLTSGGTVANYEALWNLRSVKFYGVALQAAARSVDFDCAGVGPLEKSLSDYSAWELMNLSLAQIIDLRRGVAQACREARGPEDFGAFAAAVRTERIETLGTAGFFQKHADLRPPCVMVPASAHYSWEKGMKVLGLGTANLVKIDVDQHMRIDPARLEANLAEAHANHWPVLAVVGVMGTTEFGTIDPIHEIVRLRTAYRARGGDFGIHVDAAWGGYLASMFRLPGGAPRPREAMRARFRHFPSEQVHQAFGALGEVDSITVDPHKMGYVPYAAGAFVARDRRVVDFLTQKAAYVFDLGDAAEDVPMDRKLRGLGQYILEGSKSGAAAASVYVTHRVMPLHADGFGRLLEQTVDACEAFYDSVHQMAQRLAGVARIVVPFEPDTNLVCLAVNPVGNESLAEMNRFGRELFSAMKVDSEQPVQVKQFIASYTSLLRDNLPDAQAERIAREVGIPLDRFTTRPDAAAGQADHVFVLRHTLMNPWLLKERDGRTYIDRYLAYLEERIRSLTGA